LHYAAATGKLALVNYFVDKKGFSIVFENNDGDTASSYAEKQIVINKDITK
jgi:hypothetical protein